MIRKNMKLIIGIILGIISVGGVYATSSLNAENITINKDNMPKVPDKNLKSALDYLYDKSSSIGIPSGVNISDEAIYYTTVNASTNNITTNYVDLVNAGKTYFIMDSGNEHTTCLYYNNKLHCFRPDHWVAEYKHAVSIFGTSACSIDNSYQRFQCSGDGFFVSVSGNNSSGYNNGYANVGTSSSNYCDLRDGGYFTCK